MTTHTIKAKRLSVTVGVTCDGCLSESEASLVLRSNGDGVVAEMTMPKDWRSVLLSKPEDGEDGEVTTNDLCPSCAGGVELPRRDQAKQQESQERQEVDESRMRELAVKASVHPRTVRKALLGEPIRGMAGHRVLAVLKEAGIDVPAAGGAK